MRITIPAALRLALLAAGLVSASLPARAEDATTGKILFETHCLPCHGPTGEAGSGGDIRGMTFKEVSRATRGFEQMPAIDLTGGELQAIVNYLGKLADS